MTSAPSNTALVLVVDSNEAPIWAIRLCLWVLIGLTMISNVLISLRIIYGDCLCGTLLWRRRKRLMESMTSLNSITIEDLHDRRKKIISEIEPRLTLPLHPPTMNRRVRAAPPPPKPRRPKATRQRRSSDGPFENLDGTLNSL
ncbi:hypothetical protein L596_015373 [Steinernema carpocapsae]|uniref:Uncharacterized protein n=1 Tax=Steinernema carpocapsae TaxID=34508 RepID=A0A4U5NFS6_STECR|nr:hypothetical protein L596_015373 [Steinernema carpocapsae]